MRKRQCLVFINFIMGKFPSFPRSAWECTGDGPRPAANEPDAERPPDTSARSVGARYGPRLTCSRALPQRHYSASQVD